MGGTIHNFLAHLTKYAMILFDFQARRFICGGLASLLAFKTTTQSPFIHSPNIDRRSGNSGSENYRDGDGDHSGQHTDEKSVPNNPAVKSILDLLETKISIDDEDRQKSDRDAKTRRDWMLAAAVIDRLCFIALIIVFVVGTLLFVVLFVQS